MENRRGDLVDLSPLGFGGKGDIVLLEGSVEKDKMMLMTMRSYTTCTLVQYIIYEIRSIKSVTIAVVLTRLISFPLGFWGRRDIEMPLEGSIERPLSRGELRIFWKKKTYFKFPGYDDS